MEDKTTVGEFIEKFDCFRRIPDSGNVIIHSGVRYGFIELTEVFVDQLKDDLSKKIMMASSGIDELSPTDKFAIMMLEDAY